MNGKNSKHIKAHIQQIHKGATARRIENKIKKLEKEWADAAAQPTPARASIVIEWKKSRTWGRNYHATALVVYPGSFQKEFTAACSGCGYDKESTVVADLLNQFMLGVVIKKMKRLKEFPYGLRHDDNGVFPPRFSGGVGMSCYKDSYRNDSVLQVLGWSLRNVAYTNTMDVWELTPASRRKTRRAAN